MVLQRYLRFGNHIGLGEVVLDFKLTAKQQELNTLLAGAAMYILAYGGARSAKTFALCRAIVIRAMRAPGSRHLIARYRFNAVIQSVWHDTLPKVFALCFPEVECKQDKQNFFWTLPNGSQIWFGGLDERERTEKILGNEYATVLLNECSQISFQAFSLVSTRLAQNCGLALKLYLDQNPPMSSHWSHRLFLEKRDAMPPYKPLEHPEQYAAIHMNPADNAENLPASYLQALQKLPPRERLRFWEGRFGSADEGALWTFEGIEATRVTGHPDLQRIVVAVDPSGTRGPEDERSDHVGIVVAGLGTDGEAYVLEDVTVKAGPSVWGRIVVAAYDRHDADAIVAETNFGGGMVGEVVRAAAVDAGMRVNYREVRASRGKVVRAEPVAMLYGQNKVHHVGSFPLLEDELTSFTSAGHMGDRSPDRADALIWALSELFPRVLSAERNKKRRETIVETCADYSPFGGGLPHN